MADNDPQYAKTSIVLNLSKSIKNYKSFLIRMRNAERSLPNDGEFTSENLCNIILKYPGRKLTIKMSTHDFYLHGYKDNNGEMWEMRMEKDVARLMGSKPTYSSLTYPTLKGLQINKEGLVTAFNDLAQMGENVEIANNFARLCLVLSEAARFEPVGTEFGYALCHGLNIIVDEWIVQLVKHWALLTSIAAQCHEKHVVLTDKEKDLLESRKFSIFHKQNGEYSRSQCRMAKAIIAVAHLPRV